MTALRDQPARDRIRGDLSRTYVVEAAAGTGKTTELVHRVVTALRSGAAAMSSLIAVTFTEKAAGEMKLRLREAIDRALAADDGDAAERQRLIEALGHLELARIGTIHGLCADLLRERPIEAGVDPEFRVIAEDEAAVLLEQAVDDWFERALSAPGPGLRRFLRRSHDRDSSPRDKLQAIGRELVERRDHAAPWRRDPFDRDAELDAVARQLRDLCDLRLSARSPSDPLASWLTELDGELARTSAQDPDAVEAALCRLVDNKRWQHNGSGTYFGDDLARADVVARRDATARAIAAFARRAQADLAALIHAEMAPAIAGYERRKAQAGGLDFLDLLIRARDLLRDAAPVRAELQARTSHIFVDEFQDTDPLQAEILLLLAADEPGASSLWSVRPAPGKLFVVGDPKQAIYRFRRADVALYERVKQLLVAGGAEVLTLQTSFRAVPGLQAAINHAFAEHMTGGAQATYVPLWPWRGASAMPPLIALPAPAPFSNRGNVTKWSAGQSLPAAVASFIRWMIEDSGWTVREHGADVPVASRHVCLLFRRMNSFGDDLTRPYVRALEVRRIPHVLVGGRSYHGREEVMAARAALTAIEWPGDELAVYAVLRGPMFGFTDDTLLVHRAAAGRLHPLRPPLPAEELPAEAAEVAGALALLGELHRKRNRRPIADSLGELLARTRAHAGIAIWPTGEQALANLLRIQDLGRRFEAGGATSFREFCEWLDAQAAREQAAQAPIVEEGTDGVRIMTVHRAKGLEFPIVILCDPFCPRTARRPSRWADPERGLFAFPVAGMVPIELWEHEAEVQAADEAEEVRVTYVAATRARELLVVPAVGEGRLDGWTDVLHPALYPEGRRRRAAAAAPGCPPFGPDTVAVRPSQAPLDPGGAVAPGLHDIAGGVQVVWWDPNALDLDDSAPGGIRQQELFAGDTPSADDSTRAWIDWRDRRERALTAASVASERAITATARAALDVAAPAPVTIETTAATATPRPHGRRFGTLVHAVLADTPLAAGEGAVRGLAELHGRLLGAPPTEREAAVAAALAALAHPVMVRAAAAETRGDCRREEPLVARGDDGTVVEGVCDLAFRDAGGWTVVDFKTDDPAGNDIYARQIAIYADAIARATGEPARGLLLWI